MKRSQIDNKYKWNIEEIFSNDKVFYKELSEFEKQIDFLKYKGKLNTVEMLKKCLDELYLKASNLEVFAVYAMMKKDEDGSNSKANEMYGLVEEISILFSYSIRVFLSMVSTIFNSLAPTYLLRSDFRFCIAVLSFIYFSYIWYVFSKHSTWFDGFWAL